MAFPCDGCGLCCHHVDKSEITVGLDRGDGTCLHLGIDLRTCLIYENRPDFCKIDDSYHLFSKSFTLIEYYKANADVCNKLRRDKKYLHPIKLED
jgi:Fe-S-cluster containining protein